MTRRRIFRALALLAALQGLTCSRLGQKHYPLKGVVQHIESDGGYMVSHEDIPGLMPAMTMAFHHRGDSGQVQPGDRIEATLVMTDKESWLEDITITARGLPVAKREERPGADVGDELPDIGLVNQDGQAIKLSEYRGRTLILTFIYTRCPVPEFCPLMMRNFRKLDALLLAEDPALFAKTHLLSISFDTAYDRPEVLRSFGSAFVESHGKDRFSHWELATGSAQQVKEIAGFFGLEYWSEEGEITHSLRTAIIRPDGKVAKVYRDNLWTAEEVLQGILRAAS